MTGFIYVITNDVNGKQYVGKTTDSINIRFQKHLEEYDRKRCEKRPLYSAMNKYGIEHFSVQQLEECNLSILNEREQYWIKTLNTFHNGYNATYGGDGTQLYDYELFVKDYDSGMTAQEIAEKYSCDLKTIRLALVKAGRNTFQNANNKQQKIGVIQLDKKTKKPINTFISARAAAKYLQENNYTKDKRDESVLHHILQAARGERSTAYGFQWKLLDPLLV